MRLLLVEDDPELGPSLKHELEQQGFAVDLAEDGRTGEFLGATEPYDIVVLDLGLPELPGLEVLRRWREARITVPVLILTARDSWSERIIGFKAGADDYLGKPFHAEELVARVLAIIKRTHGLPPSDIEVAGLSLDEDKQTVTVDGDRTVSLSSTEFRILRALMLHPGKVLSKSHLMEHIYGVEFDSESNVIEVYIGKLRAKLGGRRISTRKGQGYVLESTP
jgi:DNA-binding response OmpR family regulator